MHPFKYEIAQKALLQDQEGSPFYTLRELANEYNVVQALCRSTEMNLSKMVRL